MTYVRVTTEMYTQQNNNKNDFSFKNVFHNRRRSGIPVFNGPNVPTNECYISAAVFDKVEQYVQ